MAQPVLWAIGGGAIGVIAIGGDAAGYYVAGGGAIGKCIISAMEQNKAVSFF